MRNLAQDLRYAWRMLVKDPAFTALAALTLALGIGANSTIFSWINATLLTPVPGAPHSSALVSVSRGERASEVPTPPFSYPDYRDLRDRNQSLAGLLAYHHDYVSITEAGKPERIYGTLSSANYFDVLGVRPILGRGFLPGEELRPESGSVVVIAYSLWQSRFGSDRSVIGKTIHINRHAYTIVGVAPAGFQGCMPGIRSDIWIPIGMIKQVWGWGGDPLQERDRFILNVLGRLKPGVDSRQAESELNLLMERIVERFPETHRGPNEIGLDPLWRSPFGVNVYLYRSLPMLLGLAALLLLLACANVANLLLVRSVARRREIAIRLSMGATRWQLVRQLLIESLLLAFVGGILAMLLTVWSAGTLAMFSPAALSLPLTFSRHADVKVLLATSLASLLTALVFGVVPALRSASVPLVAVLKEEAGSTSVALSKARLSSSLVVAQISLSLLLLVSAGLFTRSLQKARQTDPGFDADHVLLASYELGPSGYSDAQAIAFHQRLLARLEAIPGVQSATLADFAPLNFTIHSETVQPQGYVPQPRESMDVDCASVGPNYLRTLRTPLLAGREFTSRDVETSQPVAMVNREFVDRYWPGQDAIGKRVGPWRIPLMVVGVVANAKYRRLTYPAAPMIYLPLYQSNNDPVIIQARFSGDSHAFAKNVDRAVHDLDSDLPVFNVTTLESAMKLGNMIERVAATFAGSFGLLALLLAAVGIYGVVAYSTRQRTREIGIRMALGAEKASIFRLVLRQGFLLTALGLAIGAVISLALTRLLRSQLFGVAPTDLLTFATVGLLLAFVALLACYVPAHRATQVDPLRALRSE
jgi:predicted permease